MGVEVIGASMLLTCNEQFDSIEKGGVAFLDDKILDVGKFDDLCQNHGVQGQFFEESVLLPAFINAHTHIEFSAHSSYSLGSFSGWLSSVMSNQSNNVGTKAQMQDAITALYKSGVGSIGAISSHGADLEVLSQSSLRVLYFNELIGSDEQKASAVYEDFLKRVLLAEACVNDRFKVGIALHSPYSVAPTLLREAIEYASQESLPLSVHFLESHEEREWLEDSMGFFKDFYASFNPNNKRSFYNIASFLSNFGGFEGKILFVHCTQALEKEIRQIAQFDSVIVSCPRSNRLLDGKMLDYAMVEKMLPCLIATDSLASNTSLSILDELRVALFAFDLPLEVLAKSLLLSVTQKAGRAMNLNCGVLASDYHADMAIFKLPSHHSKDALSVILHAQEADALWIAGGKIL